MQVPSNNALPSNYGNTGPTQAAAAQAAVQSRQQPSAPSITAKAVPASEGDERGQGTSREARSGNGSGSSVSYDRNAPRGSYVNFLA